ncbi:MAG: substrate-binding domain-containing protein, partial [Ilumatobacteraceae bacterium]
WLKRRKLPLVFIDQVVEPGIASINIDDRAGARAAAQHLVDLGHRRVAIVAQTRAAPSAIVADPVGPAVSHVVKQRMLGWLDALEAAGVRPTVIQEWPSEVGIGDEAAALLFDRSDRATGVLCYSDVLAYGVVQAALARGLRVPEDLSVVGFDDNPLARRMRPALTTVRQDVAAKGHAAAAALTAAIERSRTGSGGRVRHVVLPTELVVRDSTAPPSSAA